MRGVKVLGVTNDFFVENNLHYITVWARSERLDTNLQPQVGGFPLAVELFAPCINLQVCLCGLALIMHHRGWNPTKTRGGLG